MRKSRLLNGVKGLVVAALATVLLAGCSDEYIVLKPKGPVGQAELDLIILSTVLCAIVVIPVIGILIYIILRYRDKPGNKAPYQPEWKDSKILEIIWWAIPVIIIGILGVYTVKGIYALTKPPVESTDKTPVTIQVTSLNWKWLFEYPDQGIATVNYAEIPTGVPIQFVLTSDAPMNSFWVPQLGGQEYTMPGMKMRLWLQADSPGKYFGSGANFTGEGFAHMQFYVKADSQTDFNAWVDKVKSESPKLTKEGYNELAKPSTIDGVKSYSSYPKGLYNEIIDKNGGIYMKHDTSIQNKTNDMSDMNMDNK